MNKRLYKKLSKRFTFASIACGKEGLINIHGITNHDKTFMKKYSYWGTNDWCGEVTKEEIKEALKGVRR